MSNLEEIRKKETMKKVVSSIDTNNNTDLLYRKVWKLFEKNADKLKTARLNGDPGAKLEIISALARHFLRKGINWED